MALKKLLQLVSLIGAVFSACFDNGDKEIGGSCYKFVPQKLTFADAQYWCHYQNPVTSSYLAYMPNQFTSNFLASYARSAFETDDGNFWIGLSRKNSSSPWIWDNGQSLAFSNFGGQLGQNFAAESIVNAKWNAFGSTDKKFFVCSYDPQAPPTFGPPVTDIPMSTVPVSTEVPPTPTDDTSCNPTVLPQSVLFAYSNDLSPQTVSDAFLALETLRNNWCVELSWFGSVRFDVTGNMNIVFSRGVEDANSTILNNLPNPNQGFQNSSIGSNVFDVIEKFFSNTEAPVCGSTIVILLKRYPNEVDISRLASLIRYHHAILHVITSTTPSGGSQPKTMYSVASKTNGMGAIDIDDNFRVIISKQMSICPRISGAFLSAGIYKLHELVNTKYGRDLGLTPEEAALCSCDYDLLKTVAFPILIANCKLESPKLFQQNVEFSQLVKNAQYKEYAGEDHFSILTELTNENSVVNNDFYKFLHSI